jgi:proline iminopeptidase
MSFAHLPDTDLYYHTVGQGHPCLLMHGGFGLDHHLLSPWLDPLGDTLRLIYYDHRCNGQSGRPPLKTFTFEQLAEDANRLCAHLGVEQTTVLGHSLGGFPAIEYALRYPHQVSRLILISTSPAFDYPDELVVQAKRNGATPEQLAILAEAADLASDERMREAFQTVAPLYFHRVDPSLVHQLFAPILMSAAACARGFQLLHTFSRVERLRDIRIPTLIIVGQDDFICPVSQSERLHKGLCDNELVIFKRSGHFPYIEEPELFFSVVRKWLAQTSR